MSNPVLMFMDFVEQIIEGKEKKAANLTVVVSYITFGLCALVVSKECSDLDFSAIMTLGSGVQTFGFFLLLHKVKVQNSVAGISSKTLEMYVLVLMFRLSATLMKNGYLPVDKSGDFVYQAADVASLLILFQLLYCIHKRNKDTYQSELDDLPIWYAVPGCLALGVVMRGSLNHSMFYDTMWCTSLNIDTIAMLPQLHMLVKKGGEVEALTSNYIAAIFVSRLCVGSFWWHGYAEINSKADVPTPYAGHWVVMAHGLQLLLASDFMYHYCEAKAGGEGGGCKKGLCGGGSKPMVLPVSQDV